MTPLRELARLVAPYALTLAAVAGGLAFLVGGSCAERRAAVERAAWQYTRDSLAAAVAQADAAAAAAKRRAEQAEAALAAARATTDRAAAHTDRTTAHAGATVQDATARIASLTNPHAAVAGELARITTAFDSLTAAHAAERADWQRERAATDSTLAAHRDAAAADSTAREARRAALAHAQDPPGLPRFRRYIDPGYDLTHGAWQGALGAEYRLSDRLTLHARAEHTLAPVNESRLIASGRVYF